MANQVSIIDKHAHVEKAERIYQQLRSQLEAEHKGEIVAIEPESGDFFLGANVIEAVSVTLRFMRGNRPDISCNSWAT